MKKIFLNLIIISSVLLVSCTKEETKKADPINGSTTTNLNITFNNTVAGIPLQIKDTQFTNAASNKYTVTILKYYVTNISLVDENNNEFFAKNYNLIDIEEPLQNTISIKNIPTGKYTKMKFILGVDSLRNTSGLQDGFLDPSYGMIWTWNTGYIFYKHEGRYTSAFDGVKPLRLHLGTSPARGYVQVALPTINIGNSANNLTIDFDLNKVYAAKKIIDFNIDNDRQSSDAADATWIANMKVNLENSFTFGKVQ
ncbi:MAG: MbnP family protein [Candidatus Methylacidiphilales bacterium]